MSASVKWFEVLGQDADALRTFYGELFGWTYKVMKEMDYGMVDVSDGSLGGGVGRAMSGPGWVTFYVEVPDVPAALERAGRLGGRTVVPPMDLPDGGQIALFADPEGHVIGLARG